MIFYLILSIALGFALAYVWNTKRWVDIVTKVVLSMYVVYGVVMLLSLLFPGALVIANGMRLF